MASLMKMEKHNYSFFISKTIHKRSSSEYLSSQWFAISIIMNENEKKQINTEQKKASLSEFPVR